MCNGRDAACGRFDRADGSEVLKGDLVFHDYWNDPEASRGITTRARRRIST